MLVLGHPLKTRLPCVTCWPRDAPAAFFDAVSEAYFADTGSVNRFEYSVRLHRAEKTEEALQTLGDAFATQSGRDALLALVREARNTRWCKAEILDAVERHATYAFVLDGTRMTCGA